MADNIFDKIQQTLQRIYDRLGRNGGGGGGNGNGNGNNSNGGSRTQKAFRAARVLGNVGKGLRSAASGGSLGGVGSALARVGAAAATAGSVVLGMGVAIGAVVAAFIGLTKITYKLIAAQLEQQRELIKFSGAIAASFGVSGLNDALRQKKKADGTAQSTIELNETFTRLKDSLLDYDIFWTNIKNKFLTTIANGIIPILDGFAEVASVAAQAWDDFTFEMELAVERIKHFGLKSDKAIIDELRKGREEAKKQAELDRIKLPAKDPARDFLNTVAHGHWGVVRDKRPKFF